MQQKRNPKPVEEDEEDVNEAEDEVDPDLEETDEEKEEEVRRPVRATTKKRTEGLGTKASKSKSALSQAFAAVPMTNNADDLPPATYEAILRAGVLQDADARGQSVRFNFDLCDPRFSEANNVAAWRKLLDENDEPVGGGVRTLYNDLAKLGYEKPADEDELIEILDDITNEQYGVLVKISYRKWEGNDYQTVNIVGKCDNEVVQEYRENVKF
jgi:hypothetical protein